MSCAYAFSPCFLCSFAADSFRLGTEIAGLALCFDGISHAARGHVDLWHIVHSAQCRGYCSVRIIVGLFKADEALKLQLWEVRNQVRWCQWSLQEGTWWRDRICQQSVLSLVWEHWRWHPTIPLLSMPKHKRCVGVYAPTPVACFCDEEVALLGLQKPACLALLPIRTKINKLSKLLDNNNKCITWNIMEIAHDAHR